MTKKELASFLGIDTKTLYNWEKNKPNLYKTVMKGMAIEEAIKISKENYEKIEKISIDIEEKIKEDNCRGRKAFSSEEKALSAMENEKLEAHEHPYKYKCPSCGLYHYQINRIGGFKKGYADKET